MSLVVETHRTAGAMDALREEWDALREGIPDRSPFLAYDWFRCCLEDADGAEPFLLAVREEGRLLGVAPLARSRVADRWGRARTLGFLRCRETPFADFVVRPDRRTDVVAAFWRHLHEAERDAWDLWTIGPWPEASPHRDAVRSLLREHEARWTERTASMVPVVAIEGDWEAFWGSRTYLFRKSRRGILNRMAKLGEAEIHEFRTEEAGEALRALFEVAGRAWKSDEGVGITSRETSKTFFAALTERASRRGWLRLWVFRLNGAPVAIEYHLQENGVAYALRAEFDQEHRKHSPGAYLEYHILRRLFDEGARAYYTGPGLDEYKRRWTEDLRRNVTVTVYRRSLGNGLRWAVEGWAMPRLRRWRERFRRSGEAPAEDGAR